MSGKVHAEAKAPSTLASSFIPVQSRLLQRKSLLDGMSGLMGELADSHREQLVSMPPLIQSKLTIGQPHDRYEQEADRVAEQVMRMPEPQVQRQPEEEGEEELIQTKPLADKITPLIQRPIKDVEEKILQTKENPDLTHKVTPDLGSRIQSLKGSGQPLPEANRGFMEREFGIDFNGVRLHTDSDAAQISRELNAEAFTYGRDIYFGAGRYSPGTSSGKRLLAHELTHVVQQQSMEGTIRCFPTDEDECPGYQPGERSTSLTASGHLYPDVTLHAPGQLLIADFGVDRQSLKSSTQAEPLLQVVLNTFESDNSYRLSIFGYSDCVGSDSVNTDIRHGRAEQLESLLSHSARSRVTFRGGAGLSSYVTNNNTSENRAKNRGVMVYFSNRAPTPTTTPTPPEEQYVCGPDVTKEPGLKTETQISETVPKEKEKTIPEPKPTVEEDCFSSTDDSCGEYDDATSVITIEGKKVDEELPKLLSIPDDFKGILSKNWEIRFMQKGKCCSYISFRSKSGKKEGVIADKFKWEVTPFRGEFRYRKNTCTEISRCSGQISSEGTITIFPYGSLTKKFEKVKGWEGQFIPQITLNLAIGSNIYTAPPESENIVRLIFFGTFRVDSRWDFEFGNFRLRYGLTCPFAESELGTKPVWNFTIDKCWENLKNGLPQNLDFEIKAPKVPVVIPELPEIPSPITPIPSLRLPIEKILL